MSSPCCMIFVIYSIWQSETITINIYNKFKLEITMVVVVFSYGSISTIFNIFDDEQSELIYSLQSCQVITSLLLYESMLFSANSMRNSFISCVCTWSRVIYQSQKSRYPVTIYLYTVKNHNCCRIKNLILQPRGKKLTYKRKKKEIQVPMQILLFANWNSILSNYLQDIIIC